VQYVSSNPGGIVLHDDRMLQAFDGVRRRVLPSLYKALVPGAPDHQVKGALWQINMPAFAKYAMTGTLADQD
jgi:hypothetical protein